MPSFYISSITKLAEKIIKHPIRIAGRAAAEMNLAGPFKARIDL